MPENKVEVISTATGQPKGTKEAAEMAESKPTWRVVCKYCRVPDYPSNMHCDAFTKEYYHERCRPSEVVKRVKFVKPNPYEYEG